MKKILIGFALLAVIFAGCSPGTVVQVNPPEAGTPAPSGQINVPGVSINTFAPGPNPLVNTVNANDHTAGVLLGIWHGIISPVTLVIAFFYPGVQMYEVHNNGNQYNLGFLIGVAIVFLLLGLFFGSRR